MAWQGLILAAVAQGGSKVSFASLHSPSLAEKTGLHLEVSRLGLPPPAVLDLRSQVFRKGLVSDLDAQDAFCHHLSLQDGPTVLASCRLRFFPPDSPLTESYCAQFYDLGDLRSAKPSLEIGRFCLSPLVRNPDVLRLIWGGIARILLENQIGFLLGCSSFQGADPQRHLAALSRLAQDHLAPKAIWPKAECPHFDLTKLVGQPFDQQAAQAGLPPLLRSYLGMGAWVSQGAVLDHQIDTLHLFTGLDLAQVPPARWRMLKALAEGRI